MSKEEFWSVKTPLLWFKSGDPGTGLLHLALLKIALTKTLPLTREKVTRLRDRKRNPDLLGVVSSNSLWLKADSKVTHLSLRILNKELNYLQINLNAKSANSLRSLLLTIAQATETCLSKRRKSPSMNLHHWKKRALRKMMNTLTSKTLCRKSSPVIKCNNYWSLLLVIMRLITKKL